MAFLVPRVVSSPLRKLHRKLVFDHAMKRFTRDPRGVAQNPGTVFDRLAYGWGNEGWSGQSEYLQACVLHAFDCKGPILECGSGLTTLVVGYVAQIKGLSMWSLEHQPPWAYRLQRQLDKWEISTVQLCISPIRQYGEFDWYTAPLDVMPEHFPLVICDGPPSAVRGGRYGLTVVMRDRLLEGCTILLDDASRSEERSIAERWTKEFAMSCQLRGSDKPYFVLKRPDTSIC